MSEILEDNSINEATDNDGLDVSLEINLQHAPSAGENEGSASTTEEKIRKARKDSRKAGIATLGLSSTAIAEYSIGKHPDDPHRKFPSFIYRMAIFGTFLFGMGLFFFSFVLPKHPKSVGQAEMLTWIAYVLLFIASCLKVLVMSCLEFISGLRTGNPHHKFPSFIYPISIYGALSFGFGLFFFSFLLPKHLKVVGQAKKLIWVNIAICLKVIVQVMS
ncbi:uncharacterized protein LOC131220353 [Magnolia sinica]|uniref:uncharacterized protein LOC131220353 n=1 Tax=Magnolia sinica TaxID=86752 RepID=UPI00265949BD|nr:uncharacterized protein LOC131220353 [Magnolia sinica]